MKPRNPSLFGVLDNPATMPSCCFVAISPTPFRHRGKRATAFALAHDFEFVYVLAIVKPGKRPQRGLFFQRSLKPGARWHRGHWEREADSWQKTSAKSFCNDSSQALLNAFHEVTRA